MDETLPQVGELDALYADLSAGARIELLQQMLTAAPEGGQAMIAVLDRWLMALAVRQLYRGTFQ